MTRDYVVSSNPTRKDKEPGRWGMFSHSYVHDHKQQCQPYIFATTFEGSLCPLAPQMSLGLRKNRLKNNPKHDVQGK